MKIFAAKRLAYFDDFEGDPEVQKAIKSNDRFNVVADEPAPKGQANSYGNGKRWNRNVLTQSDGFKFQYDYLSLSTSTARYADLKYRDGLLFLVISRNGINSINTTDDLVLWDRPSRTILYVHREAIEEFKEDSSLRDQVAEALDSVNDISKSILIDRGKK